MNKESYRHGLRIIVVLQIFIFGFLSIIATGGDDGGSPPPPSEKPGSLSFDNDTYVATEGTDATITITVLRSGGSDGAASVDYATTDGTASDPGDYTATSGTLNWADGEDGAKTFDVTIVDDAVVENQKAFTVTLSNAMGADLGGTPSATVNINDDELASSPGTLKFGSTSYAVTEGVDSTVTITVTRTLGSFGAVTVDYATADGTATAPGDYTAQNDTLSWADGDASAKSFDIPIADDSTAEVPQSFTVALSNPTGSAVLDPPNPVATVTITDNDTISGTVFAPAGQLAFREPGLLERVFATVFGKNLKAAISDVVSPVPAGITVNLYEVDANGAIVGTAVDTTTTDSQGGYELTSPPGDAPAVKYIVQAEGTTETLASRVTGMEVDIDPSTDATSRLVTEIASDLSALTIDEVKEIQEDVEERITHVDTAGLNATQLSEALYDQVARRVGSYNLLTSKVSAGEICGTVTSLGGSPLADIDIIVRHFANGMGRARTTTDTNGDYCVNVPIEGDTNPDGGAFDGEYVLGAFNRNDDSGDADRSASEWWSSGGDSYTRFDADKITVTSADPSVSDIDLQLAQGGRVTGTVTASDSLANLEGVNVILNDFDSGVTMASARVEADGTYRVNVKPGTYLIEARNTTRAPYSSEIHDGPLGSGTNVRNLGQPVEVTVGAEVDIDFTLSPGFELTGTITDGATSEPVQRSRVKIDFAGQGNGNYGSEDTDRQGYYHIWLMPATYNIYAYGQAAQVILDTADATAGFSSTVSTITGVVQDSDGNPVSRAKMRVFDENFDFVGFEASDRNGAFTSYTALVGNHYLEVRIDRDDTVGSIIYDNQTQLQGGTALPIASVGDDQDLGTIALPDGGVLRGNVYQDASKTQDLANFRVQVRDGGTAPANRFIQVRTRGDGSYVVSLPATTYDRVKMRDATGASTGNGNCNNVPITAGVTTVLNYINDSDTCELNP